MRIYKIYPHIIASKLQLLVALTILCLWLQMLSFGASPSSSTQPGIAKIPKWEEQNNKQTATTQITTESNSQMSQKLSAASLPVFSLGTPQETMSYYLKSITGDRIATLDDYQRLLTLPEGKNFKFPMPIGQGHFIMAVCIDLQNNLWVGTEGEGLYRFNPTNGMWTQFVATKHPHPNGNPMIPDSAVECGMGDNYIYGLACDHQGRIWIGHLNHGITVFNGDRFQSYESVAGLSRHDSLNGPIGDRVFRITVAPEYNSNDNITAPAFHDEMTGKESSIGGSVWICTSAGLSIYFPTTDTWSYITRADGLPSNQINSLAFGKDGIVYVGTQCDGVAIGFPDDHYKTWNQVARYSSISDSPKGAVLPEFTSEKGTANIPQHFIESSSEKIKREKVRVNSLTMISDELTITPTGDGLPSNFINDLFVASDGTVYVATNSGLAWSINRGQSWRYARGVDYAEKVRLRIGGPPSGWKEQPGLLQEDYLTKIGEMNDGAIWVGTREKGYSFIKRKEDNTIVTWRADNLSKSTVRGIVQTSKYDIIANYLDGIITIQSNNTIIAKQENEQSIEIDKYHAMPSSASIVEPKALIKYTTNKFNSSESNSDTITLLNDDWKTQGDWLGRYGKGMSVLAAAESPDDFLWGPIRKYGYDVKIGSNHTKGDSVRYWVDQLYTRDNRALELPKPLLESKVFSKLTTNENNRRISLWDDHGETYSKSHEGPNIVVTLFVPSGLHIVSLYFLNQDGHVGNNVYRDYAVDIVQKDTGKDTIKTNAGKIRTRVCDFWGGVYKRLLVRGPSSIQVTVNRNYSFNTELCAIMFDSNIEKPYPYYNVNENPKNRITIRDTIENRNDQYSKLFITLKEACSMKPNMYSELFRIYVEIARGLQDLSSLNNASEYQENLLLECYYNISCYEKYESIIHGRNGQTPRRIEHQLKWTGIEWFLPEDCMNAILDYRKIIK